MSNINSDRLRQPSHDLESEILHWKVCSVALMDVTVKHFLRHYWAGVELWFESPHPVKKIKSSKLDYHSGLFYFAHLWWSDWGRCWWIFTFTQSGFNYLYLKQVEYRSGFCTYCFSSVCCLLSLCVFTATGECLIVREGALSCVLVIVIVRLVFIWQFLCRQTQEETTCYQFLQDYLLLHMLFHLKSYNCIHYVAFHKNIESS